MENKTFGSYFMAVLLVLIVSVGCSESTDEGSKKLKAPFFDGLYLKYDVTTYSGDSEMPGHEDWNVVALEDGSFRIKKESYTHMPDGRHQMVMARTFIVNDNGIVTDCEIRSYEGGYCPIWMAVDHFKVGDFLRDAGMKIFEETTWNGWETYRISDKPNSINFYYELDQGFLVGTDGIGIRQELTLVENNVDIPTS